MLNPVEVQADSVDLARTPTSGPTRDLVRRLFSDPTAVIGLVVLLLIVAAAVCANWVGRIDPAQQDIINRLAPPSGQHWLGTDDLGRDVFSRLVHGARVSLLAGPLATAVGVCIGAPLGILAGYVGRSPDAVLSRFADALMSLPPLIVAVTAIAVLGKGVWNAMIAIGIVLAPRFYRIMRASTQRVAASLYIEAGRSIGCSHLHLVLRHVLPAVKGPLIVQVTLAMGLAMLGEVALSFLGLGVQPPQASWGSMMSTGYQFIRNEPWLIIVPGVATFITVLAVNYVGEGLRHATGRQVGSHDR